MFESFNIFQTDAEYNPASFIYVILCSALHFQINAV